MEEVGATEGGAGRGGASPWKAALSTPPCCPASTAQSPFLERHKILKMGYLVCGLPPHGACEQSIIVRRVLERRFRLVLCFILKYLQIPVDIVPCQLTGHFCSRQILLFSS